MITGFELLEMIKNTYPTIEEQIDIANELIYTIEVKSKKLIAELEEEIQNESLSYSLCPKCGGELRTTSYKNPTVEHFGTPCNEIMYYTECSRHNCDFSIE